MTVSVLIRVHGEQTYLEQAVRSALTQITNHEFDVWLILDRPGVQTRKFVESFSHPKLKTYETRATGFSAPIAELIENLGSDFIAILDSDDLMHPFRIQNQVDFLNNNPGIGVVGSAIILIDADGNEISRKSFQTNSFEVCKNRFKILPLAHPASMIRREILIQVGNYRSFYDFAEDYDLWLRILEVSAISNLSDFLTFYRIHDHQTNSANIASNVLAGVLARKSGRRRLRGASDYSEKSRNPRYYLRNPIILFEFCIRTLTRIQFQKAIKAISEKRFLTFFFIFLSLSFLNPKLVISKLYNYR